MNRTLLFVLGLVWAGVAAAQEPGPVTVDQAVQEAIANNLSLMAERVNVPIAEARIVQARLRPNPIVNLGLDYQDWFGTGFTLENNGGPPEGTVRVDYTLEMGGKRARRVEVAEQARSVAQLQLQNTLRQLIFDVQSAFVDVALAKESLALGEENRKALDGIVQINTARVKAGDLAQVELVRSRVAALQAANAVRQAEMRVRTSKQRLQLLMGRKAPSVSFDVTGALRRDQGLLLIDELRSMALASRPDIQAQQRDRARADADFRLQQAQAKQDLTLSTQYHGQYKNSTGHSLGVFLGVPLPVFNRNQGEIERARRERDQIDLRIKALEASVGGEVQNAFEQYTTARGLLESIEHDLLDRARQVRETTEYSYRRGEASFVEFLDAQRAFNDTMQGYNEARAEYARSLYLLDAATGKAVNR